MQQEMTIREISDCFGITRRNIQEMEKKGLVTSTARNHYGHLLYDEKTIKKIVVIRFLQKCGLSLIDIKAFFAMDGANREIILKKCVNSSEHMLATIHKQHDYLKQAVNKIGDSDYINQIFLIINP